MRTGTTLKILGLLLMLFSLTLVPPILVELFYQDGFLFCFQSSLLLTFFCGLLIWYPNRKYKSELRSRDGFFIVVLFWSAFCLAGALPFMLSPNPDISFTDALFESVSGITTTGSTVLSGLDNLPHSILYYRQQLQFLGGIGIIILAVAILPMLGVGGMQLFRAEVTGPIKDTKLTPRITETAKAIWVIYLSMAAICALLFWVGGMGPFDAVAYSFSTVSTGGYAPHDLSMGYYHNPFLKIICILFMLLASISFNLHYIAFKWKKVGIYSRDPELKMFLKIMVISFIVIWGAFVIFHADLPSDNFLIENLFQVVSLCTTTGLASTNFSIWPAFVPLMLLFCGVIGGCTGSTTGGLKIMRVLLLLKQGTREIKRLVHPQAHYVIKIGETAVPNRVIEAVWGYLAIYIALFTLLLLLVLAKEQDFYTAFTAVIATFSNIGPGLGEVASNFQSLSNYTKWVLSAAMLLGRLEMLTVLVLFSPTFWHG